MDVRSVSIVVPTFNRLTQLRRTIDSLRGQVGLDVPMELVVVSDGSTDGTLEYLCSNEPAVPVIAVGQTNSGPAAARNAGVDRASGDIVVFLDDDVVAAPDLLAAHVARHRDAQEQVVVIGPMLTPDVGSATPWVQWEQDALYKQYDAIRDGAPVTARQFYTANASLPRPLFLLAGGFDPAFKRAEDVEFAYRLADLGTPFVFAPEATVVHHAERSFAAWLAMPEAYGRNDVAFARDRGQAWILDAVSHEFSSRHRLVRAVTTWCLPRPRRGHVVVGLLTAVGRLAGRLHLRRTTSAALSGLYNLVYYRAMADELAGGPTELLRRFDRAARPTRLGFVVEQTLGHITHTANLRAQIIPDDEIEPLFAPIPYAVDGVARFVPGFQNWTVRAGVRARRAIRRMRRDGPIDALFIHTQVPAILLPDRLRRTPTVVSLDATPLQYDELGSYYGHAEGSRVAEGLKWRANRMCFRRAAAIVTWAQWTKDDLVARYDVPPEKVTVIPPGVDYRQWAALGTGPARPAGTDVSRVLFVGGDFDRKGGAVLLQALSDVRATGRAVELDIVTRDEVGAAEGVRVHHGLGPNSAGLMALYRQADIFCLPTFGDCLPMVLSEAGAVGMPLIATDVGAIHEIVRDGATGILVPVGDVAALTAALRQLHDDEPLRRRMGAAARDLVRSEYDAADNARRLIRLMRDAAQAGTS